MNEKSAAGGSRNAAIVALISEGVGAVRLALAEAPVGAVGVGDGALGAVRGGPQFGERPGFPPKRPPDKLSQPSTRSLKKSMRTIRFEVKPPCECPASQNALMFSLPICSTTEVTMFWRYSSSYADHDLVGELGVATTRRYLST